MIIRIKNLRLRGVIGINDWERKLTQDITINIKMEFDGSKAAESDDLNDTIDYKRLKHQIIKLVDDSSFGLIETLSSEILKLVMEDERVCHASVEVDKPNALRYADSVSVTAEASR